MKDLTTTSPGARRTRRQLIASGTTALTAVFAAEAITRPAPAQAANGNPILLGEDNTETFFTSIINNGLTPALTLSAGGAPVTFGDKPGAGLISAAGAGDGVRGVSTTGNGVFGDGDVGVSGVGRIGVSGNGGFQGVAGVSQSVTTPFGTSPAGDGVYGQSGTTASTVTATSNGVHGITDDASGSGVGVLGENVAGGTGVAGVANSGGDGVSGTSDTGTGVTGASTGGGDGVSGTSTGGGDGVAGTSDSGRGVVGVTGSGKGVFGQRGGTGPAPTLVDQHGVHGVTDSVLGYAVYGEHLGGGAGVVGSSKLTGNGVSGTASGSGAGGNFSSGTGTGAQGSSGTGKGVWGISGNAGTKFLTSANGVHGLTASAADSAVLGEHAAGGPGVTGVTTGATAAVHGKNSGSGAGLLGESPSGTGVSATGKTALHVAGPAVFSRSGKLTIKAGSTSATKTGLTLTAASLILATLQNDVSGAAIRSAVPNPKAGSFTVHLAKPVTSPVTIAWFIVN